MLPTHFNLTLMRHPATPAPVVRSIEAHAGLNGDGYLELAWCLRGDMARLLIPEATAQATPGGRDGLWEHTCFEAFVGLIGETSYHEYNFSPSGEWAAYAFSDYRQRDETRSLIVPPLIVARLSAGRLELEALIAVESLPATASGANLQIGLTAVVEAADVVDGSHSYWALHHPAALPDFHHRGGRVVELAIQPNLA